MSLTFEKISLESIEKFNPCIEAVEQAWERGYALETVTPLEFLDLDIDNEYKFWLLLRKVYIPENDLHELACKFAESVLHIFEEKCPNDKRPREAINAKRKWIKGEITEEELDAARAAARAAACDAFWAASWAASRAAARAATRDARAVRAVRDARAVWVVRDAAWNTVWDAEEQKQIEILREYFNANI